MTTKDPAVSGYYAYEFASLLNGGTITSVASVSSQSETSLSSLGGGAYSISGTQVVVLWSGGNAGEVYNTSVRVNVSNSANPIEVDGVIEVSSEAAPTTTSGVSNGTMLVSEIVQAAMQELGVLAAGETPDGEDIEIAIRSLNWMLKSWQSRGLTSWRDQLGSIVFPAGTATMSLPYCLDVEEARFVQSQAFERPMQRWEAGQYRQIPNKQQSGYPTAYMIAKTVGGVTMTLWPVPTSTSEILYSYTRVIQDVTDGAQAVDVPQEWLETVYLSLAARLAQPFGVTRVDPNTAQLVAQRAASLEQLLLDQDRPNSIYMGSAYGRYF